MSSPLQSKRARHIETTASSTSPESLVLPMVPGALPTPHEDHVIRSRSSLQSNADLNDQISVLREQIKSYNREKYDMILLYEAQITELSKKQQICKRKVKDYIKLLKESQAEYLGLLQTALNDVSRS